MKHTRVAVLALLALFLTSPVFAAAKPIPIKVVVVTTFEVGEAEGDRPGEFQFWAERLPLKTKLTVAGIEGPVRMSDDGVIGLVSGMRGRVRDSVAALLLDPRFDFTKSYWIVAGIAGVDPMAASPGSAAWAKYVVDADPVFEIDDREIPKDWPWGIFSLRTDRPSVKGSAEGSSDMVWSLNPTLADWAYRTTKDVALPDTPELAAYRATFPEAAAKAPPKVMIGDALATVRYWHGHKRTAWARDWVKIWTEGKGTFVMTDCEDQGALDVLAKFARQKRVDISRVMVLRTASNFSQEPTEGSPDGGGANAPGDGHGAPGGGLAGFESAYRVGAPVVKALVAGWSRYGSATPQ
jgi:purine nucleoside permease